MGNLSPSGLEFRPEESEPRTAEAEPRPSGSGFFTGASSTHRADSPTPAASALKLFLAAALLLSACSRSPQRQAPVPFPPVPAPTIPERPTARLPEQPPPDLHPRTPGATPTARSGRVPGPRLDADSIRPASNETQGELVARIYQSKTGERMPYRLFVPQGSDTRRPYPLVIVRHGSSGSGDDNR